MGSRLPFHAEPVAGWLSHAPPLREAGVLASTCRCRKASAGGPSPVHGSRAPTRAPDLAVWAGCHAVAGVLRTTLPSPQGSPRSPSAFPQKTTCAQPWSGLVRCQRAGVRLL